MKLASRAFLEGFYHKPRIDRELLAELTRGHHLPQRLRQRRVQPRAAASAQRQDGRGGRRAASKTRSPRPATSPRWFHGVFGDRYFIEIQDNGLEIQRLAKEAAVEVARRMGLPLVATSDAHYVRQEDAVAQDVLLCINTGKFRTDANRMRMEGDQFFLRSAGGNVRRASRAGGGRSRRIAGDRRLGRHRPGARQAALPQRSKLPAGKDRRPTICASCASRASRSATPATPNRCAGGELSHEVLDRLDRELDVINKLGFRDYFLIVWDFVRFAGERDIPCTARGSGVGSLVCYALHLSHVCPLEYDLLFERFLDESRLEAPDIDIDFCKDRRGEVIHYVKEKYGEANVAQIGTFGTLAARAAIRDVGRTLGMPISARRPDRGDGARPARHHARQGARDERRAEARPTTATPRSAS